MKALRSAEDVCSNYHLAVLEVRELTKQISPSECTVLLAQEAIHWELRLSKEEIKPCISKLFSIKRNDFPDENEYQGEVEETESDMCERCIQSLKAVRDRKVARQRLGAAKRAVDAVGKRLINQGGA